MPVAGGRELTKDQVAGLLAAEEPRPLFERHEHVAVAHVGLDEFDAARLERTVQSQVAHRGHDESAAQGPALGEVQGEQDHHVVAVAHRAVRVDRDEAIGVAVEGEAQVGAEFEHGRDEVVDVGRAARPR